jgi:putative transposase
MVFLEADRDDPVELTDLSPGAHAIQVRHLIHDRDTKYSKRFRAFWKSEQVKCLRTSVCSPMANSYVECYIGKTKREWLAYYNEQRPHQGTDIGNKILRPDFTPTPEGEIKREQRLGGIISYYYRNAA